MKTVNRVFCASHVLSLLLSIYLGVYSIQQPIEVENIVFQMSLTDGLILSVFFFLILFIGNIFGSVASFFEFFYLSTPFASIRSGGTLFSVLISRAIQSCIYIIWYTEPVPDNCWSMVAMAIRKFNENR